MNKHVLLVYASPVLCLLHVPIDSRVGRCQGAEEGAAAAAGDEYDVPYANAYNMPANGVLWASPPLSRSLTLRRLSRCRSPRQPLSDGSRPSRSVALRTQPLGALSSSERGGCSTVLSRFVCARDWIARATEHE